LWRQARDEAKRRRKEKKKFTHLTSLPLKSVMRARLTVVPPVDRRDERIGSTLRSLEYSRAALIFKLPARRHALVFCHTHRWRIDRNVTRKACFVTFGADAPAAR
jgi:hypothetical protein